MSEPTSTGAADSLTSTVCAAQAGDAAALEQLVLSVHDRVYRLSLRMTARPPDAEDATQEILIRVITRLSTFRGEAALSTWVHRIAVNHLLHRSKNTVERLEMTFDAFALTCWTVWRARRVPRLTRGSWSVRCNWHAPT